MVFVFVVSKGAASKRKGYWSMLTIHSTKQLSSWQHKTNEASDSPCWLIYSHQQHHSHMKDSGSAGRGGGENTPHETRPHKPRGFLLITNVHPLHSALSQSGPLRSIVLMLKSRTEHNVFLLLLSLYWTEILISQKQHLEVGQRGKNNTKSLLPWIKNSGWIFYRMNMNNGTIQHCSLKVCIKSKMTLYSPKVLILYIIGNWLDFEKWAFHMRMVLNLNLMRKYLLPIDLYYYIQ